MISGLKKSLYFPLSYYFRFFAKIRLMLWSPYIIVVTGSSGKTTLLHLIESQIGNKAKYSHHANSAYGIPFDILGLKRHKLVAHEWISLFIKTPLALLTGFPKESIYIVEADCDRPGEGRYLASLLKPNISIWTNSTRTHSAGFDKLVEMGKFATVEEAIAYEFGYFMEYSKDLTIVNGDSGLIEMQFTRTRSEIGEAKMAELKNYEVTKKGTVFTDKDLTFKFNFLLPEEFYYSLKMSNLLLEKIGIKPDLTFSNFSIPPGRNSIFNGTKNTTLIDSSYNANLDSMTAILNMFGNLKADSKWVVLGDMLEQGESEQIEHEKLAEIILEIKPDKIILMGPRVSKYTFPLLDDFEKSKVLKFLTPDEVLSYLKQNINGGETILFKGARFLEGVIENLLADKKDAAKLARREKVWEKRRAKFGL